MNFTGNLYSLRAGRSQVVKGFTIVELLVAVGITALLVASMLIVTINVINVWGRTSGSLAAGNQARLILDQITQDLQAAVFQRDNNVWLAASIQGAQTTAAGDSAYSKADWTGGTNLKPNTIDVDHEYDLASCKFGQAGVWLRFFTIPSDENDELTDVSAPRAIAYQIIRVGLGTAPNIQYTYQLFRSEVSPMDSSVAGRSTFEIGYDLFTADVNGYNAQDDGWSLVNPQTLGNPKKRKSNAGNIRMPNAQQLLANDIVDFGIRFYEPDSSTPPNLIEIFPVDRRVGSAATRGLLAVTMDTSKNQPTYGYTPGNRSYGYPTVAEVMVRILTAEGARLLQAYEENHLQTTDDWWGIVEKNSQVYTRRIEIKATAL